MAAPGTAVLSFGLVAIPVRILSAIKDQGVHFNWLHAKCGSRIRNQIFCPVCKETVERDQLIRGYEISDNQYIKFTEEELDSLEAEANKNIELKEFIPISKVDPVYFGNSYFLGPEKGGEKAYRLLTDAMVKSGRGAVAEMVSRGKEELVIIRPYQNGLLLQTVYYANEVRDFSEINRAENVRLSDEEKKLSVGLIERLTSEEFQPENYTDEYRARVNAFVEKKSEGQETVVTPAPAVARGQVIDIMEALKRSIEKPTTKKKAARIQKKTGSG